MRPYVDRLASGPNISSTEIAATCHRSAKHISRNASPRRVAPQENVLLDEKIRDFCNRPMT